VDRILDMGLKPAIQRIAVVLPQDRQTLCYSVTLNLAIREVASLYLRNPVRDVQVRCPIFRGLLMSSGP